MPTRIVTYSGTEPKIIPPDQSAKIIEILLAQVEVLKLLATTTVVIPEGTKLSAFDLEGTK
jgi:hypothetical protein